MKIIVTGATGMVGAEVIRQAILDKDIEEITAIVRKPLDIHHPKIKTILHQNFSDYSSLSNVFKNNDALIWCLGISQSQVSKEKYNEITFDYTLAVANEIQKINPSLTFLFLSGEGADRTEKSKTIFARVKGKAENALIKLEMKHLYIARPGGIKPIHKNPNTAFIYKLLIPFFPLLELLFPTKMINSVQLAKAMLNIVKTKPQEQLWYNMDLKNLSKKL